MIKMIEPHKYMQLDTSVINITCEILKVLLESKKEKYNVVYSLVSNAIDNDIILNFDLAVSFLYLLGKLDYDDNLDTLELII